jgi:hypothetical protein
MAITADDNICSVSNWSLLKGSREKRVTTPKHDESSIINGTLIATRRPSQSATVNNAKSKAASEFIKG